MPSTFFSTISEHKSDKGLFFSAVAGFSDETGYVLATEKKSFRDEKDAQAFVKAVSAKKPVSRNTSGSDRDTSAHDDDDRTAYSLEGGKS